MTIKIRNKKENRIHRKPFGGLRRGFHRQNQSFRRGVGGAFRWSCDRNRGWNVFPWECPCLSALSSGSQSGCCKCSWFRRAGSGFWKNPRARPLRWRSSPLPESSTEGKCGRELVGHGPPTLGNKTAWNGGVRGLSRTNPLCSCIKTLPPALVNCRPCPESSRISCKSCRGSFRSSSRRLRSPVAKTRSRRSRGTEFEASSCVRGASPPRIPVLHSPWFPRRRRCRHDTSSSWSLFSSRRRSRFLLLRLIIKPFEYLL